MALKVLHTYHKYTESNYRTTRESCRGIVLSNGKILLSHEIIDDLFLIPGGGLEKDEDLELCCVREIKEETGYLIRPVEHYLDLYHYFEYKPERQLIHYFKCEVIGKGEQELTDYEKKVKLTPEWIDVDDALKLFGGYKDLRDEAKRKLYNREFLALDQFIKKYR